MTLNLLMSELLVFCWTDKPNVAFSASLFGHAGHTVGGYSTREILKFQKVFTNIGQAYSPSTGTESALSALSNSRSLMKV